MLASEFAPLCLQIPFCIINTLLHPVGLYMLWCLKNKMTNDLRFLTNLSVCEFTTNILVFIEIIVILFPPSSYYNQYENTDFKKQIYIAILSVFIFGYYTSKCYLICDRMFSEFYGTRYRSFWNGKKIGYLLSGTWFVGFLIWLMSMNSYKWYDRHYIGYGHQSVFVADLVLFSLSLFYIFFLLLRCRRPGINPIAVVTEATLTSSSIIRSWKIQLLSKHIVTLILSMNYVLIVFSTNVVNYWKGNIDSNITHLLYSISFIFDVSAYILIVREIRELIFGKLRTVLCCCKRNTMVGHSEISLPISTIVNSEHTR